MADNKNPDPKAKPVSNGGLWNKTKADTTKEKVEVVAHKTKSTTRKLTDVVGDVVREIADKVSGRNSSSKRQETSLGKEAQTPESKVEMADVKIGALTADVTSEQIRASLIEMPNSATIREEADIETEAATDVKQHYFHDQHVHEGPPPAHPPRDLPNDYGDTKLVLLVRDPEWVYTYWEINESTRNELEVLRNGNTKRHVLRLYKVTGRNWPDDPAHYFFDVDVTAEARSWYVQLPEANEVWCAELGVVDNNDNYVAVCRSNRVNTPRNSISDAVDSEWMTVEESFEKITRLSGANLETRLRGDTKTASESILRHIHRQMTGVKPGERMEFGSGIFSSEAAARRPKDFWLQVHTELILYGATEPDARVTVQGRPVALNDDGTFSMRYALPDGEQILEVTARNADDDKSESATPVVTRSTR